MGKKKEKKHRQQHAPRTASYYYEDDYGNGGGENDGPQSVVASSPLSDEDKASPVDDDFPEDNEQEEANPSGDIPSKYLLYQQSVQSPKGDISYLQKFFLMYVGGRVPLHFQEDFCGTALLSTEWLRGDSRRTAVGVDLDLEALEWCMENNINKVGADVYSRISLFHGNVLQPLEAKLLRSESEELMSSTIELEEGAEDHVPAGDVLDSSTRTDLPCSPDDKYLKRNCPLPARDIVCAFNFSCCCLHKRGELVLYFKNVLECLSKKGGIFVMDLYGGTSSEQKLRLQRRFPNFTYMWEQAEFDILARKTRISLHFHLLKQQRKIRHAFSYSWRLWSLPEIKDCLEEAGFRSVHFWLRKVPDVEESRSTQGFGAGRDIKYEEVQKFEQEDSWNAYIVAVAN
ncbi:unnamed protein product [Linum tenue]|uniref:S-adenosyl-L-methionine-dependent methyltransferase superfamily protein n=1 Tax=Linum tenue TaxID=586396 RepID=A0AAV0IL62_9ROSI|nr:unnamed protein product [Linum tenue]